MKTEEAANATIAEINAYVDGWQQRFEDSQLLAALYCAMPVYQTQCKRPPNIEDLVPSIKNRKKDKYSDLSLEDLRFLASDEELTSEGE